MVDFSKKLGKAKTKKPIDPLEIYDTLDRASDKGPLRPAQEAILTEWHEKWRGERDLLVKLQTGQGKTLIGLLMLQSRLNEGAGPAVYLCANNYLVKQTQQQAAEFGFKNLVNDPASADFLDGRAILINNVNKLFNGLSQFGLGPRSIEVGSLLMDDSHACTDAIREACSIRLPRSHVAYQQLLDLFSSDLEFQGAGSFADIQNGKYDIVLPVPYWSWRERQTEVVRVLSARADDDELKFVWALLKDELPECLCVVSGAGIEIAPYLPPLPLFGSYWNAKHRVFMSATITNDSFLVRGLGLQPKSVKNPLTYEGEKWYGEKMVLIPALIDESITRDRIIAELAPPLAKRKYGVVVLVPSFARAEEWKKSGGKVVDKSSIDSGIAALRQKQFDNTLVIVNKYDGIDLPDETCRILIIDSKPFSESLVDRYMDSCRASSEATFLKLARTIEQGMGRAVRGQRDYCVVILTGTSLVRAIRTGRSKFQFSDQTREQIELGLEVAELAKDEIDEGVDPYSVLSKLIGQSLKRDSGWKEFYSERMNAITVKPASPKMLDVFATEERAEQKFQEGAYDEAVKVIQEELLDKLIPSENKEDRGWYLQEIARFKYPTGKSEANDYQIRAHKLNRLLLKPKTGMSFEKLLISQKRIANIKARLAKFESNEEMILATDDIAANLEFGVSANEFEDAFDKLGIALGFGTQRPDKEWKEGPDNLWALRDGEYLLVECKSEVEQDRKEIHKSETGQMNNACAWFSKHYHDATVTNLLIIPTKLVSSAAGFNEPVRVIRKPNLKKLVKNFRSFILEFKNVDLRDVDDAKIQKLLKVHTLTIDDLRTAYSETPKNS
jgi:replicative superfamily II helicase